MIAMNKYISIQRYKFCYTYVVMQLKAVGCMQVYRKTIILTVEVKLSLHV